MRPANAALLFMVLMLLLLVSLVITIPVVCGMPVQVNIPFRGKECLYDFMEQGYVYL